MVCPQVPEALEESIARATAKNPQSRFQSMHEMAPAMRALRRESDDAGTTIIEGMVPGMKPWKSWRRPASAIACIMLVLLLDLIFHGRLAPLWKETAPPAKMRLAILPFTNIGSRAENQEICDGLVETLATKFHTDSTIP